MVNARKISRKEQDCMSLWGQCCHVRDKWCILCGAQNKQAHHLFLRSQGNWVVEYDPDYGACLCIPHHNELTAHPYGEDFDKVINRIRQVHDEIIFGDAQDFGRADKILTYKNSAKKPCVLTPDFEVLKNMLSNILKNLQDRVWTEFDCEPGR